MPSLPLYFSSVKLREANNLSPYLPLHLCIGDDKENKCLSLFIPVVYK